MYSSSVNEIFLYNIHTMQASNTPLPTLLSSLESFTRSDAFSKHAVHPYATDAPDACGLLQDLINTTENISHSLQTYNSSLQLTNPKLISLMRQQTSLEHTAHSVSRSHL
jgi:hypothetical protein